MSTLGIIVLVLAGIAVICIVAQDAKARPLDTDRSFTAQDPACARTADRLDVARARMKREGIKTLLNGRRAWQTVNPMHAEEPVAKVLPMRRKK